MVICKRERERESKNENMIIGLKLDAFVTITIPGIQNEIDDDTTAYILLTTKIHSSGFAWSQRKFSSVVYQPRNIGVKDISAGRNQTFANIIKTVFLFNNNGYSSGLQIAKYL